MRPPGKIPSSSCDRGRTGRASLIARQRVTARRRMRASIWLALCVALCSERALAVEYSAEPYILLRSLYNDNFDLNPGPHPSVWGTIVSPGIRGNAEAENWKVSGAADIKFNRYSQSTLSNTEGLFNF